VRSQGLVLLSCCLLGGCLTQPLKPHSAGDLDRWLDAELIPGLSQALTTHPRLRQERFAVVQMRGDDIQPHIDGLTLELRRRITDALAANPGVRMAWRPNPDQHHHRRLRGADCVDPLRRGYFIGIDSMALGAGRWRLAVRILDTEDGGWVKGMSWVWQGRLDTARQQAARESREDELLRGLRVLPFAGGQPDLAAAYFANNLSCLLRQQGLSDRRVGVARSAADPPAVATLVSLLDNYLSRLHQVRITDRPGEADLVLRTELHRIDRDLYQIWVGLSPQGSTEHVAGIDTAAYLRLGPGPSGDPRH
jgi:hypothetical protein